MAARLVLCFLALSLGALRASGAVLNITWSPEAVADYATADNPLRVELGDVVQFRCPNGSFSNIIYQTNRAQFEACNISAAEGSVVSIGNCRGTRPTLINVHIAQSSFNAPNIAQYVPGMTYYFTSYSDGESATSAVTQQSSGGECLEGLKIALSVLPASAPVIRLAGGNETSGRVEICVNGVFGTVCSRGWDFIDAQVVCNQLGFRNLIGRAIPNFGGGVGPIYLDNVECNSRLDDDLLSCSHRGIGIHNCFHFEDAGVHCVEPCEENAVRLVGGTTPTSGRVEVCINQMFGTVCNNGFDDTDATVVCRQLGFSTFGVLRYSGRGVGPIHLSEVQCSGNETSLTDCTHPGVGIHDCAHHQDVGVDCNRTIVTVDQSTLTIIEGSHDELCVMVLQNPSEETLTVSIEQDFNARAAIAGDLAVTPSEFVFRPGDSEKCFEVEVFSDSALEQTLERLSPGYISTNSTSPVRVTVPDPGYISVTILDTNFVIIDGAVVTAEVNEGDTVEVCAEILEGSAERFERPVVLRVVAFGTGAVAGLDFNYEAIIPQIFMFPEGQPQVCTSFQVFQDNITEPEEESVTFVLQAFDIGIIIPRGYSRFIIIDDDAETPTTPPTLVTPTTPPSTPPTVVTPTITLLPFITFDDDTPIVDGTTLRFTIASNAVSVACRLERTSFACMVGQNIREDITPGLYTLTLVATFEDGDEIEIDRRVYIPEENQCSVILINDGLRIVQSEGSVTLVAEFSGYGGAEEFECRVDRSPYEDCESTSMRPYRRDISTLGPGTHRLRIRPFENEVCLDRQPQNFDFVL